MGNRQSTPEASATEPFEIPERVRICCDKIRESNNLYHLRMAWTWDWMFLRSNLWCSSGRCITPLDAPHIVAAAAPKWAEILTIPEADGMRHHDLTDGKTYWVKGNLLPASGLFHIEDAGRLRCRGDIWRRSAAANLQYDFCGFLQKCAEAPARSGRRRWCNDLLGIPHEFDDHNMAAAVEANPSDYNDTHDASSSLPRNPLQAFPLGFKGQEGHEKGGLLDSLDLTWSTALIDVHRKYSNWNATQLGVGTSLQKETDLMPSIPSLLLPRRADPSIRRPLGWGLASEVLTGAAPKSAGYRLFGTDPWVEVVARQLGVPTERLQDAAVALGVKATFYPQHQRGSPSIDLAPSINDVNRDIAAGRETVGATGIAGPLRASPATPSAPAGSLHIPIAIPSGPSADTSSTRQAPGASVYDRAVVGTMRTAISAIDATVPASPRGETAARKTFEPSSVAAELSPDSPAAAAARAAASGGATA